MSHGRNIYAFKIFITMLIEYNDIDNAIEVIHN